MVRRKFEPAERVAHFGDLCQADRGFVEPLHDPGYGELRKYVVRQHDDHALQTGRDGTRCPVVIGPILIGQQDRSKLLHVCQDSVRRHLLQEFEAQIFAGLVEGTGDYFDVPIAQAQTECTLEGAPSCEFSLHFPT